MTVLTGHLTVLTFLFALSANIFFYRMAGSTGAALFFGFLFIAEVTLLKSHIRDHVLYKSIAFLAGVFLLFLFSIMRVGNEFVQLIQCGGAMVLYGCVYYLTSSGRGSFHSVSEVFLSPFISIIRYMQGIVHSLVFFLTFGKKQSVSFGGGALMDWVKPVAIGLCVGVPIVLILLGLLSRGDPVFLHFLESFHVPKIPEELLGRIQLTVLFFLFLLPIAGTKGDASTIHPFTHWKSLSLARVMTTVVLLVAGVLGLFLIVQWPYVFARVAFETDLSKFGVATYSEYVRKGFGELTLVVFLVYGVLWAGIVGLRLSATKKERNILRIAFSFLFLLICLYVISIGRRIHLYQLYHGWSLVRIYGVWVLSWIGMLLVSVFLRQFERLKVSLVTMEVVGSLIFCVGFGFFNAEHFVATVHPPTVNGRVDYVYLSRLSTDGITGWEKAYAFARLTLVEKNLDQMPVIHMEDRRDVAYSIRIVSRLLEQYRMLVMQYGSEDEKKQVIKQIAHQYVDFLTYQEHALDAQKSTLQSSSLIGEIQNAIEIRKKIREQIQGWVRGLDEGSIQASQMNGLFFIPPLYQNSGSDGERQFSKKLDSMDRYTAIYSMYDIFELDPISTRQTIWLDTLFVWSQSRVYAYQKMKERIPFDRLIALSHAYNRLFEKISNQADHERTYQSDSSFGSPFVD